MFSITLLFVILSCALVLAADQPQSQAPSIPIHGSQDVEKFADAHSQALRKRFSDLDDTLHQNNKIKELNFLPVTVYIERLEELYDEFNANIRGKVAEWQEKLRAQEAELEKLRNEHKQHELEEAREKYETLKKRAVIAIKMVVTYIKPRFEKLERFIYEEYIDSN